MTGISRSPIRSLSILFTLAVAMVAMFAISPSSAYAGKGSCFQEGQFSRGINECPSNVPDACPDMAGMQTSAAQCVAPAAPAPAPAPAATPAPTPAASTPDEGFIAAPPAEYEHESLTIQAAQADPPATTGTEIVVAAAGAGDAAATAPGSGTSSAAALPSGSLPYTGSAAMNLALAGIALLWIGALSYLLAAVVRRTARDAA